ncbi:MAG: proline--tRNA ligase [Planctomycetota bacterium]
MAKKRRTAISPTREEDYAQWYQEVIMAADLAEPSDVRGCMVIKPWGYAIWEHMQQTLDRMFKETGHQNAYFPLFIPLRFLEKEAEHVEGFAKECAVVTHHRLEPGPDGGLVPAAPLEEPYIVRPTSETIVGAMYARWIQSYRDLPVLINQWANVVRWEMRTRMFLRTAEFLWQEGHTAHATEQEALDETRLMLDVYARFAEEYMAVPVIKGEKSADERFPGAVTTLCIEAMMQDRKALQSGTSHFLGQNFARAQDIKFQDQSGHEVYAWTTSWGVSTRLVGALLMAHSDDDGLVLPPRLAPHHVVILPIYRDDQQRRQVLEYCETLQKQIKELVYNEGKVRVAMDDRDVRGGEKNWRYVKQGVPLRVEIGPKDIAKNAVFVGRRDTGTKEGIARDQFVADVPQLLAQIQQNMYERARRLQEQHTRRIDSLDDFKAFFTPRNTEKPEIHGGFALCHWAEDPAAHQILESLKVTPRCFPLDAEPEEGTCIFTGKPSRRRAVFAKAY